MGQPVSSPDFIRLFPTFVCKSRLESPEHATVQRAILNTLSELRAGVADPSPGELWQSRHGLHALPELAPLVLHIRQRIEQVLAFLRIGNFAFEVTGLWANIAAPGGMVRMHCHPNNFLSGVYYVQVQPGADTINFHDPRPQAAIVRPPATELTPYNTDQVVVQVEEGTLLIFPAWLTHSVDANRSDRMRTSMSFNAMFTSYAESMGQPLWGEP